MSEVTGKPIPPVVREGLECPESDRRTKQEFKDDCDVNVIMRRVYAGQPVRLMDRGRAYFGDFDQASDLLGARTQLAAAEAAFMSLPAAVRRRFENDVAGLVARYDQAEAGDEAARDELVELGLLEGPPAPPEPPAEPPAPPAEPAPQ